MIGQSLKEIRRTRKLSQRDVARACDIPDSLISHFESDRRSPSLKTLKKLCRGLPVSADSLIFPNREFDSVPEDIAARLRKDPKFVTLVRALMGAS